MVSIFSNWYGLPRMEYRNDTSKVIMMLAQAKPRNEKRILLLVFIELIDKWLKIG